MRVLLLAAEAAPWVKVGGLADVAAELPRALTALGVEVRLALPLHPSFDASGLKLSFAGRIELGSRIGPQPCEVLTSEADALPLLLIDGARIRSEARVYGDPEADAYKYTVFSLAALAACEMLDWRPDIVHAHDWHAAPAVARLASWRAENHFWRHTGTVLTIHNLPFMGSGGQAALDAFGLDPSRDPDLPSWARQLPLPLGMAAADWLTTVSPTYAQEMQTQEFGCGLEEFVRSRAARLMGILNGIDQARWDPAVDPALAVRFNAETLDARRSNKLSLQADLGLPTDASAPLLAMVTRFDPQKGIDLALEALRRLRHQSWQFVLLGTGDPNLEAQARAFVADLPDRARSLLRFDAALSRRLYGGADALLVPSRYEPCGLAQMIAMRYGCLPIARAVGGLRDTIPEDTGFLFQRPEAADLAEAVLRALMTYRRPEEWRARQRRAMEVDFGWERSARQYFEVYGKALESATGQVSRQEAEGLSA